MVLDEADDVGGTWYWNRYPGARCDVQTVDYSYTFDPELEKAWTWSERYATQPEILRYLGFVADRYDLRRDIRFHTRVTAATWDQAAELWLLTTDDGAACRPYEFAAKPCVGRLFWLELPDVSAGCGAQAAMSKYGSYWCCYCSYPG